jgi:hypothetical protein
MRSPLPPEPVTLHTSRRGLAAAVVSPLTLLGLGGAVLVRVPTAPAGWLMLVLGFVLGAVALADFPRRVRLHEDGIDRVCVARTHRLAWHDLVALERQRGTMLQSLSRRAAARTDARASRRPGVHGPDEPTGFGTFASGGLVARGRGRRRWLLTYRMEGQGEFDRVVRLLAALDVPTTVRANRPPVTSMPTRPQRDRDRAG